MVITYDEPLFRPPSEAYSLILQITLGCSWNNCAFCEMYSSKKFRVRNENEVFGEIELLSERMGRDVRKVFLADGNPMVLSFQKLDRILDKLKSAFPKLNRVSTYALPQDIISKSDAELLTLREKGLKLLYVGIETGDDDLLNRINKRETYKSTLEGLKKANNAGIKLSVMILNGLGGKKYSHQHAVNSARLVSLIQPEYLSTLVLSFPYGIDRFKQQFVGEFIPLNQTELIQEMKHFIEYLELENTIFRSDHASNYLVLRGKLNRDQNVLLDKIDDVLKEGKMNGLRPEWLRGL